MPQVHRNTDNRYCDAITVVVEQSTVFVNSLLWAVEQDPESHGNGKLRAAYGPKNVYINNKHVIVAVGDEASADNHPHPEPITWPLGHSPNVYVYEAAGTGTAGTDVPSYNGALITANGTLITLGDGTQIIATGTS